MKKLVSVLLVCMVLLSLSFVFAAQNGSLNKTRTGLGKMLRQRVHAGVYTNDAGEEFRVSELAKNRLRLHAGNASADCDCNLTEEKEKNRTRLRVHHLNGRNTEVKIMPNVASETALRRLRLRVCNESNNCTLELKEVAVGRNNTRAAYELQAERHFRILWLFRVKAQIRAQVDAENGEVLSEKGPWWAFLASEED
jgi:hypothetical protein